MQLKAIVRRRTHILVFSPKVDCDQNGYRALMRNLTIIKEEANGARWASFIGAIEDKDPSGRECLRLPAAIPDDMLRAAWPRHELTVSRRAWAARKVDVSFRLKEFPPKNKDQRDIYDYLTGNGSYRKMVDAGSYLVVAGTAAGKSYCAIRAWAEQYGDVLLGTFAQVTHLNNFRDEILKFTDLTEDEILVIDDGRDTIRRVTKRGDLAKYKVVMILHRTISNCVQECLTADPGKVPRATGINQFSEFVMALGVGTHVSDECHLELQSLVQTAMTLNVERTFYLTATPARTEWMEDRVLQQQLPPNRIVIKSVPRVEATQLSFDSRPEQQDLLKSVNRRGYFDVPWYFEYLSRAEKWEPWFEMVTVLIQECIDEGATSVGLVVAGKLEFLDRTVEQLALAFPDKQIGNFSSRVKEKLRGEELDKDIVVTTEKSFNGSVNPKHLSHLLFCAPIASPVYVEQISGRLRGLEGKPCVLIDVYDSGFDRIREQAKKRRATYKKICKSAKDRVYQAS